MNHVAQGSLSVEVPATADVHAIAACREVIEKAYQAAPIDPFESPNTAPAQRAVDRGDPLAVLAYRREEDVE
jgi:hypothetical protein